MALIKSCFKLFLVVTAVFLFVFYMTSCRWTGSGDYHVESWTDEEGVVHLILSVKDQNNLHNSNGADPRYRDTMMNNYEGRERSNGDVVEAMEEQGEPKAEVGNMYVTNTDENSNVKIEGLGATPVILTDMEVGSDNLYPGEEINDQKWRSYPTSAESVDQGVIQNTKNEDPNQDISNIKQGLGKFYKVSGVKDEDLLRTLKEIELERKKALEDGTIKVGEPVPEVDHRNVQVYDVTGDVEGDYKCVNIHVKPQTPICLFDPKEDVYVSGTMAKGEVWEEHIIKRFQKVLQMYPDLCVLDIGANLGLYSLIAASMGHKVVAIEPYLPSLKRFHKAISIGNLTSRITVLQNAISDERTVMNIKANEDNQGDARVFRQYTPNDDCQTDQSCQKVKTIFMNDILPYIQSIECVMKIDIQGFEHRAFSHASILLDKVSIPYIFMEWAIMREFYMTNSHRDSNKSLVENLVGLLNGRGYSVYSLVSGKKLDTDFWHGWPEDVLWVQEGKVSVDNIGL